MFHRGEASKDGITRTLEWTQTVMDTKPKNISGSIRGDRKGDIYNRSNNSWITTSLPKGTKTMRPRITDRKVFGLVSELGVSSP